MRTGREACALVVEATTPIGAAVDERLARSGWSVVLNYSAEESAAERLAMRVEEVGVRAATVRGRFASRRAGDAVFDEVEERFGPVLMVINNAAGVADPAPIGRGEHGRQREATQLAQSVCMLDRALGQTRAARCGRVVNITGGVGSGAREADESRRALPRLIRLTNLVAPGSRPTGSRSTRSPRDSSTPVIAGQGSASPSVGSRRSGRAPRRKWLPASRSSPARRRRTLRGRSCAWTVG
jgi:hypothetical protein